jgi:DNA-binding MarR family transcriptional regulator
VSPDDDAAAWYQALLGPAGHPPSPDAVTFRARTAAGVLYLAADPDHITAPGQAAVASVLNVSPTAAATYLDELEAAGWITRARKPRRRTAYQLTWPHAALMADLERTTDDLTR